MLILCAFSGLCPAPCSTVTYTLTPRRTQSSTLSPNRTVIGMYYNNFRVMYGRERVLYDPFDIVAAIGGSMGLFLGFSFLDFAMWILRVAREKDLFS